MKVFYSVKYFEDMGNRQHIENMIGILHQLGYETYCVVRDAEQWGKVSLDSRALMQLTFAQIRASNWVLVDLGEKGVGLGIEAGYAHACDIRVAAIAPAGQEISTTLRGIATACCNYQNEEALVDFLRTLYD